MTRWTAFGTLLLAMLGWVPSLVQAAPGLPSTNVAWVPAAVDADIDRVMQQARGQKKPLLLYWGATWCPPCNHLKATFFNRSDFAQLSQSFVAVHVDGDRPGAQKLGARFNVRGYPTVILMAADGAEITRLPGEADAEQVMAALQAGLANGRPIAALLQNAKRGQPLPAQAWRALSYYSWDVDDEKLLTPQAIASTLTLLARASEAPSDAASVPAADIRTTSTRLWLKALAARGADSAQGGTKDTAAAAALPADQAGAERLRVVLADRAASRVHMDVLINQAPAILQGLGALSTQQQAALAQQADEALRLLQQDASLARADRASALIARVHLAQGPAKTQAMPPAQPKVAASSTPAALQQEALALAQAADRDIRDAYERQAVIPQVAYLLGEVGLWGESDALLRGNLARSSAPYYLMGQLASNARKQGQKDEALRWSAQAFERSEGPATRLQWGASYLQTLVALAPQDAKAIEATAAQLFAEAAQDSAAFHKRSARSLQRVSEQLLAWNAKGEHKASLQRLQQQLAGACAKRSVADGQRATCSSLLKPPMKDRAAA